MFQVIRVRGVNDTCKFQDREPTYWFQLWWVQKLWHMMYMCGSMQSMTRYMQYHALITIYTVHHTF